MAIINFCSIFYFHMEYGLLLKYTKKTDIKKQVKNVKIHTEFIVFLQVLKKRAHFVKEVDLS